MRAINRTQKTANHQTRRGDTMIEVMFGVAFFGLVAILTINLMNNGLAASEVNLESTMARSEMDAQADALRFIHSSYATTDGQAYDSLWHAISNLASDYGAGNEIREASNETSCEDFYSGGIAQYNSFVINYSRIKDDSGMIQGNGNILQADTYPQLEDSKAYGIWINAVKSKIQDDNNRPYYYDFYIRSCWYGVGQPTNTLLDTVVRLYNPDRGIV